MTQGIYIRGSRPKSKKEIKEAVVENPHNVNIEATSFFGNEYDGCVADLPDDTRIYFVGPDPYTRRNFYGQIIKKDGKVRVV